MRKIELRHLNRFVWVSCPCGKCISCLRRYEKDWSLRMREEMAKAKSSYFCTLTYDNEHVPIAGSNLTLHKSDYQYFLKRLRKRLSSLDKIKLRFVICGEYGGTSDRPHYHFAFFLDKRVPYNVFHKFVYDSWQKGFIQLDFLNSAKIHYLSKYFNKLDERWHHVKTFRNMSNGIGKGFLSPAVKRYYKKNMTTTVHRFGKTYSMPRYYKDRIFNERDKEKLLLDSQLNYDNWLREFFSCHGFVDPHAHYMDNNLHALEKAKISFSSVLNDDFIET